MKTIKQSKGLSATEKANGNIQTNSNGSSRKMVVDIADVFNACNDIATEERAEGLSVAKKKKKRSKQKELGRDIGDTGANDLSFIWETDRPDTEILPSSAPIEHLETQGAKPKIRPTEEMDLSFVWETARSPELERPPTLISSERSRVARTPDQQRRNDHGFTAKDNTNKHNAEPVPNFAPSERVENQGARPKNRPSEEDCSREASKKGEGNKSNTKNIAIAQPLRPLWTDAPSNDRGKVQNDLDRNTAQLTKLSMVELEEERETAYRLVSCLLKLQ